MKVRATKAEIAMLDEQICEELAEDNPQSVRHVFYRMTDPRLPVPVPKTENGYRRVQQRCLHLRRAGSIPYGWISDSSRRGYHVATFADAGEYLAHVAGFYRTALWTRELPHVEVWTESRSLAGVLEGECERLAVSLYPAGGFASVTICSESAAEIDRRSRDSAVVLYVGDYDPAGVLIDQAIEAELRQHLKTPLHFRRLAINADQIAEFDLPVKPRKESDRRRPDVTGTVEAEALAAGVMRGIVRDTVEHYLPRRALEVAKVAEQSEREGLRKLAHDWPNRV